MNIYIVISQVLTKAIPPTLMEIIPPLLDELLGCQATAA